MPVPPAQRRQEVAPPSDFILSFFYYAYARNKVMSGWELAREGDKTSA